MKLSKKMTLALGLLVAGAIHAQTAAPSSTTSTGSGLLGQRYAESGLGAHDLKFLSDDAYGLSVGANLPVVPALLDAGASYTYNWISGPTRSHSNDFVGSVTAYTALNGLKPFSGVALGWHTSGFGVDNQAMWRATVGLEVPAGDLTFTPRVTYTDDFQVTSASRQQWSWALEGNYQVNPKAGLFASFGHSEERHSPARSWDYRVGVRIKI